MHLCINMLIFTHNLGNWLISRLTQKYNAATTEQCMTTLS